MADLQRHAELFPIPAPYPWTIQICHGGSRKKRQRFRRRRALELLTNLQVAALNFGWGHRGYWSFGAPLSSTQWGVVQRH